MRIFAYEYEKHLLLHPHHHRSCALAHFRGHLTREAPATKSLQSHDAHHYRVVCDTPECRLERFAKRPRRMLLAKTFWFQGSSSQ